MVSIHQLKYTVNHMAIEEVSEAVSELLLEGLVTEGKTPFSRTHFNVCFAEIEALMQRAGYHRPLDVVGYQGQAYAMFDPSRSDQFPISEHLRMSRRPRRTGPFGRFFRFSPSHPFSALLYPPCMPLCMLLVRSNSAYTEP